MMADKICCMGVVAHVDAGKTTLSESLLLNAGAISRAGRVDNKDAYLDTEEMEKNRGITIFSKLARFSYKDTEFVLVDTPGHVDFGAEMERTLKVLDVAVLLINASDGVQSHTKTVWKLLKSNRVPTFIFVNKMDLPDTDKNVILAKLKRDLSIDMVDFSDVNSDSFYEDAATGNEALFEEYMETGAIGGDSISKAVMSRKIFPVFFGSALKNEGVKEFLECFGKYVSLPSICLTESEPPVIFK